jgi:hypothetical protein
MPTPRLYRMRRTSELRATVAELLDIARHHEFQQFLQRAVAELEEASGWLDHQTIDNNPALLTIVDMNLALAEYRLRAAKTALTMHGPNVDVIG